MTIARGSNPTRIPPPLILHFNHWDVVILVGAVSAYNVRYATPRWSHVSLA